MSGKKPASSVVIVTSFTLEEIKSLYKFYSEMVEETENLLYDIEESGPIDGLLMFHLTKEDQMEFYEARLEHYREERDRYNNML